MNKKLKRIILVDDSESDNFIHKRIVEDSGFVEDLAIHTSGQSAMDYLQDNEQEHDYPGMILIDINMPRMDGWEFLETYKNLPEKTRSAYIVNVFSNSTQISDLDKASKTLIKSYVKKTPEYYQDSQPHQAAFPGVPVIRKRLSQAFRTGS